MIEPDQLQRVRDTDQPRTLKKNNKPRTPKKKNKFRKLSGNQKQQSDSPYVEKPCSGGIDSEENVNLEELSEGFSAMSVDEGGDEEGGEGDDGEEEDEDSDSEWEPE